MITNGSWNSSVSSAFAARSQRAPFADPGASAQKAQGMLPGIVFKMRNEVDKLKRFLDIDKQQELRQLDTALYDNCVELLNNCQSSLENIN